MAEARESRPFAVVLIYSWDILLAVLALFGALAAFSGQAVVGRHAVNLNLGSELLGAVSAATYAAVLMLLASFLLRQYRWVLKVQMAVLGVAILLGGGSILLNVFQGGSDAGGLLVAMLFLVADAAALLALGFKSVVAWYSRPGTAPVYLWAAIGVWVVTAVGLMLVENFA